MSDFLSVPYSTVDGETLYFDCFSPPKTSPSQPAVICIHGGGWVSGDRSYMHDVASPLAELGYVAICPQYRFAPMHRFPAAIDDMKACVSYLREHADEFHIDPNRIAALGNSSGGHLSAMVGLTMNLQAVVDISGISDIMNPEIDHYAIGTAFVYEFMGKMPDEAPEAYRDASPISYITPQSPPFLVVHGDADDIVPIDQSDRLVMKLQDFGIEHEYMVISGEAHSFSLSAWCEIEHAYMIFLNKALQHEPNRK